MIPATGDATPGAEAPPAPREVVAGARCVGVRHLMDEARDCRAVEQILPALQSEFPDVRLSAGTGTPRLQLRPTSEADAERFKGRVRVLLGDAPPPAPPPDATAPR